MYSARAASCTLADTFSFFRNLQHVINRDQMVISMGNSDGGNAAAASFFGWL